MHKSSSSSCVTRSARTPADPPLSAAGEARAAKLAAMLGDAGIKAVYVTEFRRTRDTAGPLAGRLGLTPRQISSRATDALIASLRSEHANDIVLIVAHSNTVPAVIKESGWGSDPDILVVTLMKIAAAEADAPIAPGIPVQPWRILWILLHSGKGP